jgi:hypothetical protein
MAKLGWQVFDRETCNTAGSDAAPLTADFGDRGRGLNVLSVIRQRPIGPPVVNYFSWSTMLPWVSVPLRE